MFVPLRVIVWGGCGGPGPQGDVYMDATSCLFVGVACACGALRSGVQHRFGWLLGKARAAHRVPLVQQTEALAVCSAILCAT